MTGGQGDDGVLDADLAQGEHLAFRRLLEMLHTQHRFDFREYKTISLLRRIRARMDQVRVESFDTYSDYLRMHPHEATALFNSILINVTAFFRDPEAWQTLRREALPALIETARATGRLRVWSPGCSSGEETYSAAIVIADALGDRAADVDVKIYATDIDEEALVIARQAAFRPEQLKDVPGDIIARHFVRDGHVFRIGRDLRRWCIFGRHNVTHDPPLPQLNLLICRNLFIYFNSALQERLLARFHYALREGGVLFLGRAESLVVRSRGFVPISQRWRLFRRASDPGKVADAAALREEVSAMREMRQSATDAGEAPRITAGALLRALPYPAFLVGLDDSVREWNDAAAALYEIPSDNAVGRQFRDLDISYRAEGLRARVEDVKRAVAGARLENVILRRRSGDTAHVDFWVTRVYDERSRPAAILVAAWDGTAVARFREEIARLGEQHATASEELQATNEELETTNEELQSTNEELVTTVDELQAANTELGTRSVEVRRLGLYHAAIVNAVGEAIVALDGAFVVTSWNPAAERLFGTAATAALGQSFFSLPLGTPAAARTALARLSDGAGAEDREELELEVPRRDGDTHRVIVRFVRLVDVDGTLHGILGFGRPRQVTPPAETR